jgi:hypothetical protein
MGMIHPAPDVKRSARLDGVESGRRCGSIRAKGDPCVCAVAFSMWPPLVDVKQAHGGAHGGDAFIGHDLAQFVWTRFAQLAVSCEDRDVIAFQADRHITTRGAVIADNRSRGVEQFTAAPAAMLFHAMMGDVFFHG